MSGAAENWSAEDELRMEVIMRNGPTGEHYQQVEQHSARDERKGCGSCATCSCEKPKP